MFQFIRSRTVAQASPQWRNLISFLQALPPQAVGKSTKKSLSWRRFSAPGGWVLISGGTIGLLFWNGRLVIATGIGVAVMLLVYVLQDSKWKPWKELRKTIQGWNSQFLLAASSGGAALFGTYLASSVWVEAEHHWIATGMILQGTATLGILGLLIWKTIGEKRDRSALHLDQILMNLTQENPLKRLIAVRQLTDYIGQQEGDRNTQFRLADYLRVMLAREEDAIVRDAILEGLQILENARSLPSTGLHPLQVPKSKEPQRKPLELRGANRTHLPM